jgi:hypothetical protein
VEKKHPPELLGFTRNEANGCEKMISMLFYGVVHKAEVAVQSLPCMLVVPVVSHQATSAC